MPQNSSAEQDIVGSISLRSFGIAVRDLGKSTDFYTRVCGMTLVQTMKRAGGTQLVLGYPSDRDLGRGSRLLLMHWTDGAEQNYGTTSIKIVLQVSDAAVMTERIRKEGFEIVEGVAKRLSGNLVAFVRDPDGYLIEILQPG